ncbi:hypothetical protein D3C85_1632250 [compost metagenome]
MDLQPAGRQREFGAQLILVSAELGHCDGGGSLYAALGETHGALPHRRQDDQRDQAGHEQAQREIKDVLDDHRPNSGTASARDTSNCILTAQRG